MSINIAHVIPGSGGSFYCGNCLRDSKVFDALRAKGHNALRVPLYLPLIAHDNYTAVPVFYGAVSVYIKQVLPFLRRAPERITKLLDSPAMLEFAARMANSTRAKGLEEMTISMLLGEHGSQKHELEKLAQWLEIHFKPDVIHISNALLLGLAHRLKEKLDVPVVCSLQDEDVWVDNMKEPFIEKVWALMREKARDIDMFVAVSDYYAGFMSQKLDIPASKISTLYLGVDPGSYTYQNAIHKPKNIGYLSRLCKENGLDILVDAFIGLKQNPSFSNTKLLLTGGRTSDDSRFIKEQERKIRGAGLSDFVEFIDDFSPETRQSFFDKIAVLSVPVRNGEAFGIYLTEAMAAGIPIVQPSLGAFPEIVNLSGGGMIYRDNTPDSLRVALEDILTNNSKIGGLSENARASVENKFNIYNLTSGMLEVYRKAIENYK